MFQRALPAILTLAILAPAAAAEEAAPQKTVCELIDAAAAQHDLPVDFLTRLIWKESRFRPDAISPKGAQGIAQFMPGTAALRSLADPFDAAAAIAASAHYLHDLAAQFGNLGLAAAAYNAGERRVASWLAGEVGLPWETRDYVFFITGRSADDWIGPQQAAPPPAAEKCTGIAARLSQPGAGTDPVAVSQFHSAPFAPWGVQVAGGFSASRAMASYAALQKKYPAELGGRDPLILRAVIRSRGRAPLTQIRIPANTRAEADRLCDTLRKAGGACVVVKNGR